ncbi:MAG: DUF1853 family protein [Spirochaeta sp.]|jgi:hypothetical protein|nr:DUF1853 family protein [Spirochaeta sp.]
MTERELLTFRSRLVRDLAWAITVPSLVRPVFPPGPLAPDTPAGAPVTDTAIPVVSDPTHWLSATAVQASWQRVYPHLRELDRDDTPLRRFLVGAERLRHGLRFERLLAYWFQLDPEITVVTADRQIFADGRTVGQIDFVLDWAGEITQLEVAIKYYLQFGADTALDRYLGTDLRDRLDIKLAHMLFHQRTIRLPEPESLTDPTSVVSIRGRLYRRFVPGDDDDLPTYWWIDVRDLRRPAADRDVKDVCRRWLWARGERSHWFSPLSGDDARWRTWDDVLTDVLATGEPGVPWCEMVIAAGSRDQSDENLPPRPVRSDGSARGEVSRGFLVFGLFIGGGNR